MRGAYRVIAYLIAAGVLLQAASVAGGWFGTINEIDGGTVINEDYEGNLGHALHGIIGMMALPLLGIALLVVSFFAKLPGGVKWAGFTLLAIFVQVLLAFVAFGVPVVGALHGLNAFVVLGCAAYAAHRIAGTRRADTLPAGAPATV